MHGVAERSARYGRALNSHDLLKLLALATMIIDHAGAFLFPEQEWLRAIGRASMPLWLFIAGSAPHYRLRADVFTAAFLVEALTLLCCVPLMPVNILFAILFTQLVMARLTRSRLPVEKPGMVFAACCLAQIPLAWLFDYGALCILFALCGWYLRERTMRTLYIAGFFIATCVLHLLWAQASFGFSAPATLLMVVCCLPVFALLWRYTLQPVAQHWPQGLQATGRVLARNSLYLYVAHLLVLLPVSALLIQKCW
jgi:hypothetical protein